MKNLLVAMLCLALVNGVDIQKLADAIKLAENSETFPYGVKSVKCSGEAECRQVCINSIKNNLRRYEASDKSTDFITFMGKRWCPPKEHRLNKNWVKNVKYYYHKQE